MVKIFYILYINLIKCHLPKKNSIDIFFSEKILRKKKNQFNNSEMLKPSGYMRNDHRYHHRTILFRFTQLLYQQDNASLTWVYSVSYD